MQAQYRNFKQVNDSFKVLANVLNQQHRVFHMTQPVFDNYFYTLHVLVFWLPSGVQYRNIKSKVKV